jgi:ribonucleoside-diphosphate reductase alpha chain
VKTVKARELYARMMRTLAQTGNGWMTFKDRSNAASNQTAKADNVIHLSNLCTEIIEVTRHRDGRVQSRLGQPGAHVVRAMRAFDFESCARPCVPRCVQLDRVIDLNFYPIDTAARQHQAGGRWVSA